MLNKLDNFKTYNVIVLTYNDSYTNLYYAYLNARCENHSQRVKKPGYENDKCDGCIDAPKYKDHCVIIVLAHPCPVKRLNISSN